jgi:putative oxygen-independent coproporphyrinogen III oxidase
VDAPAAEVAAMIRALYLHIPYCERKCTYCDFTSVGGVRGQREYAEALRGELRHLAERLAPQTVELHTVFVGGGTPSLLDTRLLGGILDEVRACFRVAPGAEVTMEANPSSTTTAKAEQWLAAGVNRISLGVQSLHPDILRFLDRVHDSERAVRAVQDVRAAGFVRVNTDLIYAVPGLDDARWQDTVDRVLALGCDHLSCYELTVEEGTPLAGAVAAGAVPVVDADTALRQHWITVAAAERAGLRQYEISNFARPGSECRHNLAYGHNDFYLAAGVGAHGHLPVEAARALGLVTPADATRDIAAIRFWHTDSIPEYVSGAPLHTDAVTHEQRVHESILVGLRLTGEGVTLSDTRARGEAEALRDAGLLDWDGHVARVTARGQEMLDAVALRLCDTRAA